MPVQLKNQLSLSKKAFVCVHSDHLDDHNLLDNSEVYFSNERQYLLPSSMVYRSQLKVGNLRMCLGKALWGAQRCHNRAHGKDAE